MNITVFCGSRLGDTPLFAEAGRQLGAWIGQNDHQLVYGGNKHGLMGVIASSVLEAGGEVYGIMTKELEGQEEIMPGLTHTSMAENITQRKQMMYEAGDAFIAFPGGPGTLEEIVDIIAWSRMGLHKKPSIVYNLAGYYQPLADLYQGMVDHEFIEAADLQFLHFCGDLEAVKQILAKIN